ncbi:hypothetical protein [Streptomyces pseudogriseolus]|uniref:hypothetical protein n=1 Tax=Streptomyces pseudogriseolus TaxID=36817 RepID=UPI003FA2BD43
MHSVEFERWVFVGEAVTADAGDSSGLVEVFPVQAEEFALAEPSAHGVLEQRAQPVPACGCEERTGLFGGEGSEKAGHGVSMHVRATLQGNSSSQTACSRELEDVCT